MRYLSLVLCILLLNGCANWLPKQDWISTQKAADQAYAAGDFEQAAASYLRLAKAMPSDAGVRYQLGNSLARQGDVSGAVDAYREALVREPQHARAWHNLLQVQLREALLTAGQMQATLNRQQPRADQALQRAEQLLRLNEPPAAAAPVTEPPAPEPAREP